jgi:hypothetical protein
MRHVSIEDQGRCGSVIYHEAGNRLACYWEYGGGNVIAFVQCGSAADWASRHSWALHRRAEILQYIADEMLRQKARGCLAEINGETGDILLRQSGTAPAPASPPGDPVNISLPRKGPVPPATRAAEARWVFRLTTLRMYLGLIVLAGAVLAGAGLWMKNALFTIDPGTGTALGYSVRTDRHVSTLIQTLEPYVPSLDRNHGNDRYSVSLFLVPLDGSATRLIPLRSGLAPDGFGLAKVLGSDGRTLWFNVAGIGGVDLDDYQLRTEAEIAAVDPRSLPRPWGDWPLPPEPERFLEPVASSESGYLDAALLRASDRSAPMRLEDPAGALMLYTSRPGPQGTAVVARVDDIGRQPLWSVDTGIGRFALQQILPGETVTAFVGTRPAVPGKVSEPLLVIVENESGRQATYSLWQ